MAKIRAKYLNTFWEIEHLFGSVTRTRLLRVFLNNPETSFFVRDLSRRINTQLNAVRRELENLETLGILSSRQDGQKKFYKTECTNFLFPELRALVLKSQISFEKNLVKNIDRIGQTQLLVLTGKLVGIKDLPVDILVVGRVNRDSLKKIVNILQQDLGEQINYTVMSSREYKYRCEVSDKFLFSMLENKRVVLIDRLNLKR